MLGDRDSTLVGVNGFYDTSRLGNRWYRSGSIGLEMAALLPGNDEIDLNFNYYGNLFQGRSSIVNAIRNGTGNFDVELGYSHELGEGGPDLRLKLTGYQFDVGTKVYGWNAGAEVTQRNGMFSVKAEAGRDEINNTYYTVGGFVNVGIQLERLLSGESPVTSPEPIFKSPRNLRRLLTRKVMRAWHQPSEAVVASRSTTAAGVCWQSPLGPVNIGPGFSGGPVFIPWSAPACLISRNDFISLAQVLIDFNVAKSGGAAGDTIFWFWGNSALSATTHFFGTRFAGIASDFSASHDAAKVDPAQGVSGIWFSSTGTATWQVTVSNIRLVP